jgi:3-hydroxyisobutyrate dehydrogenase-like beta-hydroxyacid dehydrogenase
MSTISVALAQKLMAAHAQRSSIFVSAPVFGRPDAAAARKLFILAAGPTAALDRCQPLFDAMGQRTFRISDEPHLANVVKLSGNFLIAAIIESLSEAFAFARKWGLDPHELLDVLTGSLFPAPIFRNYGTLIAERRYQPAGFRLPLALKDLTLALDAGRAAAVPMPVASLVRDHMIAGLAQGFHDADWSVLGELAARNAGIRTSD